MHRPPAVTASAVVAIIGSVCTFGFAAMMFFAAGTSAPEIEQLRGVMYWTAAMVAALGAFGLWTGVEVLRLKAWARRSMLIFAGVAGAMCAIAIALVAFVPLAAPNFPAQAQPNARVLAMVAYAVPLLICVWWLWLFNTASVKAAFAGDGEVTGLPKRPMSVAIIGWWMLLGGVMTLVPALVGMPAFFAGFVFEGMAGRIVYLVLGVLSTMIGWDLLQLQERGRRLAIGWLAFGVVHTAYTMLVPSVRERMRAFGERVAEGSTPPSPGAPDAEAFANGIMIMALLFMAIGIWLLMRNKRAFEESAAE